MDCKKYGSNEMKHLIFVACSQFMLIVAMYKLRLTSVSNDSFATFVDSDVFVFAVPTLVGAIIFTKYLNVRLAFRVFGGTGLALITTFLALLFCVNWFGA